MAKQSFEDAAGNKIEVDDTVTALGPHPDLRGTSAESRRDLRYQPVRFHDPGKGKPTTYKPKTGYGVTQADLDEEIAQLAARRRG